MGMAFKHEAKVQVVMDLYRMVEPLHLVLGLNMEVWVKPIFSVFTLLLAMITGF